MDIDSANNWTSLLDSYGISYVCWNLSNKDEKSALLTPACDKTSGFAYEDLSDEGKWLYGVLSRHVHEVDADTSPWWPVRRGYGAQTC